MSETGDLSPTMLSPEALERLGASLRHARRMRGLRLKDLAAISECSESMLSKIETGRAVPSLALVRRIVKGLDVSLHDLFAQPTAEVPLVHRIGGRPTVAVGRVGALPSVMLEFLMPRGDGLMLEANIHTVSPGGSSAGATSHVGEEFGYVLDGELDLTVDGDTVRIKKGDSFAFRSERPHSYRNPGNLPARVLWVNTPPTY